MRVLRNDWPFVPERRAVTLPSPANAIERIAQAWFAGQLSWADAMRNAIDAYQAEGNGVEAARVAVNLADAFVNSDATQYSAGRLLLRAGQPDRALRYLERAAALDAAGTVVEYRLSLAEALARTGAPERSIATLETLLRNHPNDERAKYWLQEMRLRQRGASD